MKPMCQNSNQSYDIYADNYKRNQKIKIIQNKNLVDLQSIKQTELQIGKQLYLQQQKLFRSTKSTKIISSKVSLQNFPIQPEQNDGKNASNSKSKNIHAQSLQPISKKQSKKNILHTIKSQHQSKFLQRKINKQDKFKNHKNCHTQGIQQNKSIASQKIVRAINLHHKRLQTQQNSCKEKHSSSNDLDQQTSNSTNCRKLKNFTSFQNTIENKSSNNQNQKKFRQKKTVFKVPDFLKNKNKISVIQNIQKKRQQVLKNFRSIPKNFKTTQNINNIPHNESIHKLIKQKQINKRFHPHKQHCSTQKVARIVSSVDTKIKNDLKNKKCIISQGQFQIFQIGQQIELKKIDNDRCNQIVELKVLKILAQSQNSSTYLVMQRYTGFLYCLKKSQVNLSSGSKFRLKQQCLNCIDFLIRQSKIGMFLDHPFLIKTYCTLYDQKHIYQLMEFVQGSTLHNLHKQRKQILRKLLQQGQYIEKINSKLLKGFNPIKQIKQIISQLLQGIIELHRHGITHRDLKPPNIFISNSHAFKIGDFGCSIYHPTNDFVGTVDYVAPQVIMHQKHGSPTDLWAIGCIAYQLYVGNPPFYHHSRTKTIQKIVLCQYDLDKIGDPTLKSFISLILKRQPSERISAKQAYNHTFINEDKQARLKHIY